MLEFIAKEWGLNASFISLKYGMQSLCRRRLYCKTRGVEKRHRSQLGTLRSFLWSALTFTRLTVTEDHLATQKQVALVATMSSDGLGIFTKNVDHWIISHGKSNFGTFLDFTYMMNFSMWKLIQYMTKPKWRRNWSCNLPIPSLIQFLYPIHNNYES